MNCIKKFSRIVCVSLFSYQGYLSAVVCPTACLYYHKHFRLSTTFLISFEKVLKFFKMKSRFLRSEIQYNIGVAIRQPLFSIFLIFLHDLTNFLFYFP